MPEYATIYSARATPLSEGEVRLIAGTRDVKTEGASDARQIVVRWPDLTVRLTPMPSADVEAHLSGLARYVASTLVAQDPYVPERIEATKHVVSVVLDPGHDEERCELMLRAACELSEGMLFRHHVLFDASGRILAEPREHAP